MQFRVPFGALRVFINRAANRRYGYLTRNGDGTYSPNRKQLAKIQFDERLSKARSHQAEIFKAFSNFCAEEFSDDLKIRETERYFFEILFDIAPIVMRSLADPVQNKLEIPDKFDDTSENQTRYRIYRFVSSAANEDSLILQYIEEFIHGAIMAESLFYSTPAEALHKMHNVRVFLDTPILLSAIGLAEEPEVRATRELLDLLKILKARIRCFSDTQKELHGILYAVFKAKERGTKYRLRPGDVGEAIDRRGYDLADLGALVNSLDERLAQHGIKVEDRPPVSEGQSIGIDETALADRIREAYSGRFMGNEDQFVLDRRLQHDIDCVRAIFQLRHGEPVNSLEKCSAIFVTTASVLARETSDFFMKADTRLESSVPLCIGSSVFTMLMWLKATDRKPEITKDRLVANSIAALRPAADLWDQFLKNLREMLARGEIDQAQFDYISNAMETRTLLMAETEGDLEAVTAGTAEDIRQKVLGKLVADKNEEIAIKDQEIGMLTGRISSLEGQIAEDRLARERDSEIRRERVRKFFYTLMMIIISSPFLIMLLYSLYDYGNDPSNNSLLRVTAAAAVNILGAIALFFIDPWKVQIRSLSDKFANRFIVY